MPLRFSATAAGLSLATAAMVLGLECQRVLSGSDSSLFNSRFPDPPGGAEKRAASESRINLTFPVASERQLFLGMHLEQLEHFRRLSSVASLPLGGLRRNSLRRGEGRASRDGSGPPLVHANRPDLSLADVEAEAPAVPLLEMLERVEGTENDTLAAALTRGSLRVYKALKPVLDESQHSSEAQQELLWLQGLQEVETAHAQFQRQVARPAEQNQGRTATVPFQMEPRQRLNRVQGSFHSAKVATGTEMAQERTPLEGKRKPLQRRWGDSVAHSALTEEAAEEETLEGQETGDGSSQISQVTGSFEAIMGDLEEAVLTALSTSTSSVSSSPTLAFLLEPLALFSQRKLDKVESDASAPMGKMTLSETTPI